jgi:hypothetical protein
VRLLRTGSLTSLVLLLSLSGCLNSPKPLPCDCSVAEKETRAYTLKYFDALEDVGNLRQSLKACEERR